MADSPISDNAGLPPPERPETLRLRIGSGVPSTCNVLISWSRKTVSSVNEAIDVAGR